MTAPWQATWRDGAAAFERLRDDWVAYIGKWSAEEIGADRAGFATASHELLECLRRRIDQETRAFYATALQHGAIGLR